MKNFGLITRSRLKNAFVLKKINYLEISVWLMPGITSQVGYSTGRGYEITWYRRFQTRTSITKIISNNLFFGQIYSNRRLNYLITTF